MEEGAHEVPGGGAVEGQGGEGALTGGGEGVATRVVVMELAGGECWKSRILPSGLYPLPRLEGFLLMFVKCELQY